MSTDILLRVDHVKAKKGLVGSLLVMPDRLQWVDGQGAVKPVVFHYKDIKAQRISPDTKPKVQLQICVFENKGDGAIFHFANGAGLEAQRKDREAVKEMLQQFLPRFRPKQTVANGTKGNHNAEKLLAEAASAAMLEKKSALEANEELFRLYRELVTNGVVSADQFWDIYAPEKMTKKHQSKSSALNSVGVSSGFLGELRNNSSGVNDLKFNLTPDIIQSIFKTYPQVKAKHIDLVPVTMTEQEFWTKFFQSHYFQRNRVVNSTPAEIFAECARVDEQEILRAISSGPSTSSADLTSIFEDELRDEGYGQLNRAELPGDAPVSGRKAERMALVRRVNQHSFGILNTFLDSSSTSNSSAAKPDSDGPAPSKTRRIYTTDSEDLVSLRDFDEASSSQLSLCHSQYLQHAGPSGSTDRDSNLDNGSLPNGSAGDEPVRAGNKMQHRVAYEFSEERWSQNALKPDPREAHIALLALSPGGALLRHTGDLNEVIPPVALEEMRNLYTALCELLQHFWRCFPVATPVLENKLMNVYDALRKFRDNRIRAVAMKYAALPGCPADVMEHMESMLRVAMVKYDAWKAKQGGAKKKSQSRRDPTS